MDADTGFLTMAAHMVVLGAGIGLCMQVLTIGSSFGAAIFGTHYANVLHTTGPGDRVDPASR